MNAVDTNVLRPKPAGMIVVGRGLPARPLNGLTLCFAAARTVARKVNKQEPPPNFTGLWTHRHNYGAHHEIEYVNGVPNGVWRYWHEHGTCLREGFKKNGQWHGKLITRAADGTVLDVNDFDEGTGVYRIFNSNHRLTDEVPLRHGKPHGVARRWVSGKLVEIRHYVDGECVAANCEA